MYVVVVNQGQSGKIELTKDELQKMLDDAYSKGYSDGKSDGYRTITVPSYPVYYGTEKPSEIDYTQITCEAGQERTMSNEPSYDHRKPL